MCTGASLSPSCNCGSSPCIDVTFGPTKSNFYWSATSYVSFSTNSVAWWVYFLNGEVIGPTQFFGGLKTQPVQVRAVRGGL